MPVRGRDVGKKLLEAIGIDAAKVRVFTLRCAYDDVALVEIEFYPEPGEVEGVLAQYGLEPLEQHDAA